MAGHSQFKNIMHRKGRQDAAKSKLFGKLAREITVSAKLGVPDPGMNPRLRAAIIAARAENMPKDNIERAIKKATGGEGENYEQIRYEGYGPGGVAVIVEVLTDNRNRTAGEVRSTFTKSGGNLAKTGAVSFMFDHVGVIEYDSRWRMPMRCSKRRWRPAPMTCLEPRRPRDLRCAGPVRLGRQGAGGKIRRTAQGGPGVAAAKHGRGRRRAGREGLKLIESLNEHDDVQNVYANFEVSDALVSGERLRQKPQAKGNRAARVRPCYERRGMTRPIRILGIDPGLRRTGWGVVEIAGNRLGFLGCGR